MLNVWSLLLRSPVVAALGVAVVGVVRWAGERQSLSSFRALRAMNGVVGGGGGAVGGAVGGVAIKDSGE